METTIKQLAGVVKRILYKLIQSGESREITLITRRLTAVSLGVTA